MWKFQSYRIIRDDNIAVLFKIIFLIILGLWPDSPLYLLTLFVFWKWSTVVTKNNESLNFKPCLYHVCRLYNRVSQNSPFSVKLSMTGGKRKLEWRRVRKNIRFLILFIPRASNYKKNPFRGFSEIFIIQHFLMNLHNFLYLDRTKKFIKKNSAAFLNDCGPWKKSAHAHNLFLVLVFENCSLE